MKSAVVALSSSETARRLAGVRACCGMLPTIFRLSTFDLLVPTGLAET